MQRERQRLRRVDDEALAGLTVRHKGRQRSFAVWLSNAEDQHHAIERTADRELADRRRIDANASLLQHLTRARRLPGFPRTSLRWAG